MISKTKVEQIVKVYNKFNSLIVVRKRGSRAGAGVSIDEILGGTGAKIPKDWDEYVVTYKLSRKGALRVGTDWYDNGILIPAVYMMGREHDKCYACFLPKSWIGCCVTRTMKVLKKVA